MDKKKIFEYATKGFKERIMGGNHNNERDKHAETVIRNHVIWSLGAGFIPVVAADVLAVSALQLDMIRQLCRVYDINFSETQGKAIVTSLTSSTLARLSATCLTKLIPVVGTLVGGITNSVFAGASTFALGEVFKKHFESGGTILDFDPDRLKKMYKEKFEKGKKVAEQLRKQQRKEAPQPPKAEPFETPIPETKVERHTEEKTVTETTPPTDAINRLKELAGLRDAGVLSEEEFQEMKKRVIEGFK